MSDGGRMRVVALLVAGRREDGDNDGIGPAGPPGGRPSLCRKLRESLRALPEVGAWMWEGGWLELLSSNSL